MTVQPLKNEQAVVPLVSNRTTPLANSQSAGQLQWVKQPQSPVAGKLPGNAEDKDVLSGAVTTPASETASRLTAVQNDSAARSIKAQAVRTSKAVEEQMESMREKMNEIVNSYPPFLRGSEKRQQYLMSISSIRQQIEAMTFPPNKFHSIPDVASSNELKKIWTNLFQNVDIPALASSGPNEASDAQIQAVSSAIGAMQSDLSGRRAALERQAVPSTPISPVAAQYISRVTGQGLVNSGFSLTTNLTGALKGM